MKYNFDEIVNYDGFENVKQIAPVKAFGVEDGIAMWIAEMDFRTCPAIVEAMVKRVEHGVFGYPMSDPSYERAILSWYKERHQAKVKVKNINYHAGVINGVSLTLRAFMPAGSKILIDDPVYHYFAIVLKTLGYDCVRNKLDVDKNQFIRNREVFEENLKNADVFLLCSPHNPGGRIWTEEELKEIDSLCKKHGVLLISDEIHSDLIMPQQSFTTMLNISEDAIVISAASKSFNLAGMQYAFSMTNNDAYAKKIKMYALHNNYENSNTLAKVSLRSAFEEGGEWLDQVNEYIYENFKTMKAIFTERLENAVVFDLQASYLTWIDLKAYVKTKEELSDVMLKQAKVIPSFGSEFGSDCDCYIRLNLATQKAKVEQAAHAICDALVKK